MKIAIDISQIVYGTGVSVYTEELVRNLLKLDSQNEYLFFAGTLRQRSYLKKFISTLSGRFSSKVVILPPTLADIIWNRLHILPIEKLIGNVDVFHSSDWTQPPCSSFKVTTVHDLAPLRFPKLTPARIYNAHKERLELAKKEVDRVIVPSEATKSELIEYGFSPEKIRVIPEAPGSIYFRRVEEEVEKIKTKYRIRNKYILSVGVGQRKNTERLIKAFELARAGKDLKLVLIGRPQDKIGDDRNVFFLGHVPTSDKPALYSGAEALVYPSLYEGFGLPILEAFSCGTPVVTSNTSSMIEVAGDAAVLVDPYEVESIADGIKKAVGAKVGLSKAGLRQAGKFSWEKTAQETLNVYLEAKK